MSTSSNGSFSSGLNYSLYLGSTDLSRVFLLFAAAALIFVVRGVTASDPNRP